MPFLRWIRRMPRCPSKRLRALLTLGWLSASLRAAPVMLLSSTITRKVYSRFQSRLRNKRSRGDNIRFSPRPAAMVCAPSPTWHWPAGRTRTASQRHRPRIAGFGPMPMPPHYARRLSRRHRPAGPGTRRAARISRLPCCRSTNTAAAAWRPQYSVMFSRA